MAKLLTKSKYMNGLESDALLWMVMNKKEELPLVDDATQSKFDAGKEIEILARKMFEGVDLSSAEFIQNLAETKKYVSQRKIIFEAGFSVDNLYSRSDVIIPNSDGSWDLIEIKGATKVKESHVKDLAFQKHVLELSGIKVKDCFVIHLNRDYVRGDFLDIGLLFKKSEVTKAVDKEIVGIEKRIEHMFDVISMPHCPMFDYRDILKSEYGNYLINDFFEALPEHSVFELYDLPVEKAIDLLDLNIILISELPNDFTLTKVQEIQKRCVLNKEAHVEKQALSLFVDSVTYPVYYFDFQAMMPAIPLFKASRSYDQIPFMYSVFIEHESGVTEFKDFFYEGNEDPRIAFIDSLKKNFEEAGSIVIYNEAFELYRLKELAKTFKESAVFFDSFLDKIVDLCFPFKSFAYYDPLQRGSISFSKLLSVFDIKENSVFLCDEEVSRVYYEGFGKTASGLKQNFLNHSQNNAKCLFMIFQELKKRAFDS